jgi:mannan endo-1,4-beta-mannosidase
MQEWGMCYFDTANNVCDSGTPLSAAARDANIKKYADNISKAGIPWMYWQIIPNADPHDGYDYEVSDDEGMRFSLLLLHRRTMNVPLTSGSL